MFVLWQKQLALCSSSMLELKTHDEFFEFSHNSVHKLLVPKEIISQLEADFTSIGNFPGIAKALKKAQCRI